MPLPPVPSTDSSGCPQVRICTTFAATPGRSRLEKQHRRQLGNSWRSCHLLRPTREQAHVRKPPAKARSCPPWAARRGVTSHNSFPHPPGDAAAALPQIFQPGWRARAVSHQLRHPQRRNAPLPLPTPGTWPGGCPKGQPAPRSRG